MGSEPKTQNEEIERYVAGLMEQAENLEFESKLMVNNALREAVERARILFEQASKDEWEIEISEQLTKLVKMNEQNSSPLLKRWFSWKYTFVPSALAFSLGILVMLIVPNEELWIGEAHTVPLDTIRGSELQKVIIDPSVEILEFDIWINDISGEFFYVEIDTGEKTIFRKVFKLTPKEKKIKVYLTGEFSDEQRLTLFLFDSRNIEKDSFPMQIEIAKK